MKKRILALTMVALMTIATSVTAFAETRYVVTDDNTAVNVRTEPSAESDAVIAYENGTEVNVISEADGWAEIEINDTTAYISSSYLSTEAPGEAAAEETGEDPQAPAEVTAGDVTVTIGSTTYQVAAEVSEDQIPAGFTVAGVAYQGSELSGVSSEAMGISMVYLTSEAYSGWFVYLADSDSFVPFLQLGSSEHYLTPLNAPADFALPQGYESAALPVDSTNLITAYKSAQNDPNLDMSNMYYVYGVTNSGITGWFLYDDSEQTYVRYTAPQSTQEITFEDKTEVASGDASDASMLQQYRRLIAILIGVGVLLLIIIINLLLFYRRNSGYDGEDDYEFYENMPDDYEDDYIEEDYMEDDYIEEEYVEDALPEEETAEDDAEEVPEEEEQITEEEVKVEEAVEETDEAIEPVEEETAEKASAKQADAEPAEEDFIDDDDLDFIDLNDL